MYQRHKSDKCDALETKLAEGLHTRGEREGEWARVRAKAGDSVEWTGEGRNAKIIAQKSQIIIIILRDMALFIG